MSPDDAWPWSVLGLPAPPANTTDLRRAYARALKQIDQATDIASFSALRDAYEVAGHMMRPKAEIPLEVQPGPDKPLPVAVRPNHPFPDDAVSGSASPRDLQIDAFFRDLETPSIVNSTADRIVAALANPLSHDPEIATHLRHVLADMIRKMAQGDGDKGIYLSLGLRPALLALEDRYHWLSDYASFRQDFRQDHLLLEAMDACADLKVARPIQPVPRPQTSKLLWLFELFGKTGFWLGYVATFVVLMLAVGSVAEGPLRNGFVILLAFVIASAPLIAIVLFAYSMTLSVRSSFKDWNEQRQDRRVLRRKGLLPPTLPLLARLRANPNIWVYAGFATVALFLLWALLANA